jgi:hypothetical protein
MAAKVIEVFPIYRLLYTREINLLNATLEDYFFMNLSPLIRAVAVLGKFMLTYQVAGVDFFR